MKGCFTELKCVARIQCKTPKRLARHPKHCNWEYFFDVKQETLLIGWNLFWWVNKGWISGVECIGLEDWYSLLWPKCEHFDWINFLGKLQLCHFFEDVKIGSFKDVLEVVLRPANKNNLNFTKWSYIQWGSEIRTCLDFEWSKQVQFANGPVLKWDQKFGLTSRFWMAKK